MYTQLNCKTIYSVLSGIIRVEDLVKKAKEMDLAAISISDKGNLSAIPSAYKKAKDAGIKLLIGVEMAVKEGDYISMVHLIAKDYEGYQNLSYLISKAEEGKEGEKYISFEDLCQKKKGILFLSGGIDGIIPMLILQGKSGEAAFYAEKYKKEFGEDFYLEGQYHSSQEGRILNILRTIGTAKNIKVVATNAPFYLEKEDARIHDAVLCMAEKTTVKNEGRKKLPSTEYYFKSEEEMLSLFKEEEVKVISEIVEKCNVVFEFGQNHMPKISENDEEANERLKELSLSGLKKRYPNPSKEKEDLLLKRLFHELSIIEKMGFPSYFLVVADFVRYAKENDIPVGPGRGSAAGSLVSYCCEITDIDPIDLGLLFERFLNPDRVSMPDVDVDFCAKRRGEVISYVREKYGDEKVCQIITFGKLKAKSAIRAIGRIYDAPLDMVDKIAKAVPNDPNASIAMAMEIPSFKKMYDEDEKVRFLVDRSKEVEGIIYNTSVHAGGVVITDRAVYDYAPVSQNEDGVRFVQFTMEEIEDFGLIKFDFLGLRNLTVIRNACREIEEEEGVSFLPSDIDFSANPEVYKMLSDGNTMGVFQLESGGMTSVVQKVFYDVEEKIRNIEMMTEKEKRAIGHELFERLIAILSLYRPGPMDYIDDYVRGMKHPERVVYDHPVLEDILKKTYGVIVYQEQVMQVVQACAGYTLAQADNIRRIMSKKKVEKMAEEKIKFLSGCQKNGISEESANVIWDKMEKFCEYAFNKSHAAGYAALSYQTAYLKYFHQGGFVANLLTSVIHSTDKDKLGRYCNDVKQKLKIDIVGCDVNISDREFKSREGKIYFGLSALKGVGDVPSEHILEERKKGGPFKDIFDFCKRCPSDVNRRVIDALIKGGGFDFMEAGRSSLLFSLDGILEYRSKYLEKEAPYTSVNLWERAGFIKDGIDIPKIPSDELKELSLEKDVAGIYISGHPSTRFQDHIKMANPDKISDILACMEGDEEHIGKYQDGDYVVVGGVLFQYGKRTTKKKEDMGTGVIEDFADSMEFLVFPKYYEKLKELFIQEGDTVLLKGRLSVKEEGAPQIHVFDMIRCEQIEDDGQKERLLRELEKKKMIQKTERVVIKTESTAEKQEKEAYLSKTLWVRLETRKEMDDFMNTLLKENDTCPSKKGKLKIFLEEENKILSIERNIAIQKSLLLSIQKSFGIGRVKML